MNPVVDLIMDGHFVSSETGLCRVCGTLFPCRLIRDARRANYLATLPGKPIRTQLEGNYQPEGKAQ